MTKYTLNPYLFLLVNEGKVICWDYKSHQQFELGAEHLDRLIEFSANSQILSAKIDQELKDAGFIVPAGKSHYWGWDVLSQIFHYGTQINNECCDDNDTSAESFSKDYLKLSENLLDSAPAMHIEKAGVKYILPCPDDAFIKDWTLVNCLKKRKTCRMYSNEQISLQTVSTLLNLTFGEIRSDSSEYEQYGYQQVGLRKSSPSAGGLQATEAYLISLNIEGLPKGIFHYQSHTHSLTLINEIDLFERLPQLFCGQYFSRELSLGIFLTSRFDKLWHKYPHSRAYRVALLDAGHLSQTFQLVSTAMRLNPWLTGSFVDEEVNTLLGLKDECEQPIFFVGAGTGDQYVLDVATQNLLKKECELNDQ